VQTDGLPHRAGILLSHGEIMTTNEIILSKRIPKEAILSGEVNHLIRLAEKNKWSKGSVFELKYSYMDKESIEVVIVDSIEQVAKYISEDVLIKAYYHNKDEFRQQWERWSQKWNDYSNAWVIEFKLCDRQKKVVEPVKEEETDFMEEFF